jgi:hypothetical protein
MITPDHNPIDIEQKNEFDMAKKRNNGLESAFMPDDGFASEKVIEKLTGKVVFQIEKQKSQKVANLLYLPRG